jgi:hypothetical protein
MADEPDVESPLEKEIRSGIAQRAIGQVAQNQVLVPRILVDDENLEKLTNLGSANESKQYAKVDFLLALADAAGHMDDPVLDENGKPTGQRLGFMYPDFKRDLVMHDHQYRTSIKAGTRKILESITRVIHGPEGKRGGGFFGR